MLTSFEQPAELKNDVSGEPDFNVLRLQTENGVNRIPINKNVSGERAFLSAKKPTENLDVSEISRISAENTKLEQSSTINDNQEKFILPKVLKDYLFHLSSKNSHLKSFEFNVTAATSVQDIKDLMKTELNDGHLNNEQVKEIFDILCESVDGVAETHEVVSGESTEKLNEELKIAREDYIKNLASHMQLIRVNRSKFGRAMEDLGADRHMPLPSETAELKESRDLYIRRRNAEIKSESGGESLAVLEKSEEEGKIVMAGVIENLTTIEKDLNFKALKVWESGDPEALYNIGSIFAVENGVLKFVKPKKIEAQKGFRMSPDTLVSTPEPEVPVVAEATVAQEVPPETPEVVAPEVISEVQTEPMPEPIPQEIPKVVSEKLSNPIPTINFEGKVINVVLGEPDGSDDNIIKIIFDGEEIAKGMMTEAGPEIDLNKDLKKSSLFLAKTDSQRAFDLAMPLIKTLKKNP